MWYLASMLADQTEPEISCHELISMYLSAVRRKNRSSTFETTLFHGLSGNSALCLGSFWFMIRNWEFSCCYCQKLTEEQIMLSSCRVIVRLAALMTCCRNDDGLNAQWRLFSKAVNRREVMDAQRRGLLRGVIGAGYQRRYAIASKGGLSR